MEVAAESYTTLQTVLDATRKRNSKGPEPEHDVSLERFMEFLVFAETYLFQWLADISTDMRSTYTDGKLLVPRWDNQAIDGAVFNRVGHYFSQLPFMAEISFLDSDFWPSVVEVEEEEAEAEAAAFALAAHEGDDRRHERPLSLLPKGFVAHKKIQAKMLERIPPGRLRPVNAEAGDGSGPVGAMPARAACLADLRDFERLQLEIVLLREAELNNPSGAASGAIDPAVAAQLTKVEQTALLNRAELQEMRAEMRAQLPQLEKRLTMSVSKDVAALAQRFDAHARAGALGQGAKAAEDVVQANIEILLMSAKAGSPGALESLKSLRDTIDNALATVEPPPMLLLEGAAAAEEATEKAAPTEAFPPTFKAFDQYCDVKAVKMDWDVVAASRDLADPTGAWRRCQSPLPSALVKAAFVKLQKEYSKRKVIVAAVNGKMEADGMTEGAAIAAVEAMRAREGGKKLTVYQLFEALSAQSVRT